MFIVHKTRVCAHATLPNKGFLETSDAPNLLQFYGRLCKKKSQCLLHQFTLVLLQHESTESNIVIYN